MKLTFFISIVIFLTGMIIIPACKKPSGCHWDAMPSSLFLEFRRGNNFVPDSILTGIKLSYFDGSSKKYVLDFVSSYIDSAYKQKGLIGTRDIGFLSGDSNVKTYYLEYPNGWSSDTLYVDYLTRSPATNCVYVQKIPKINGKNAPVDSTYLDGFVYIINK